MQDTFHWLTKLPTLNKLSVTNPPPKKNKTKQNKTKKKRVKNVGKATDKRKPCFMGKQTFKVGSVSRNFFCGPPAMLEGPLCFQL